MRVLSERGLLILLKDLAGAAWVLLESWMGLMVRH